MADEINEIKINMAKFETKLESFGDKLNEHISDQKNDLEGLKKLITDFVDSADNKYAPMWTADAIKWTIVTVMGAIILAVLGLIIIK
jgi:hypothetical protein